MIRDLDAYLQRIGFAGKPRADLATLQQLVLRHTLTVPFENIDAFLGRGVSLDPQDVERKLVLQRRGGWCFEQNLLLGNVLRTLGYPVTDFAARVLWRRPAGAVTGRTHRLLVVQAEGDWLVDVGFGGQTLTGVLDLHSEEPQPTPHEPYRLLRVGDERLLETQIRGEWLPMFRFDMQPQLPIDFEPANYWLAHDPASVFTQWVGVSRAAENGRHVLRGRELAFHELGGETRRSELPDADAVLQALQEVFGIALESSADLRAQLARSFHLAPAMPDQTGSASRS